MANVTSSGGASVQATLNLNIEPFESQILSAKEKLEELALPFQEIKTQSEKMMSSVTSLDNNFNKVAQTLTTVSERLDLLNKIDTLNSKVNSFGQGFTKIIAPINKISSELELINTNTEKARSSTEYLYSAHKGIVKVVQDYSNLFGLLDNTFSKLTSKSTQFERLLNQHSFKIEKIITLMTDVSTSWNELNKNTTKNSQINEKLITQIKEIARGTHEAYNEMTNVGSSAKEVETVYSKQREEIIAQGRAYQQLKDQVVALDRIQKDYFTKFLDSNRFWSEGHKFVEKIKQNQKIILSDSQKEALELVETLDLLKEIESMEIKRSNNTRTDIKLKEELGVLEQIYKMQIRLKMLWKTADEYGEKNRGMVNPSEKKAIALEKELLSLLEKEGFQLNSNFKTRKELYDLEMSYFTKQTDALVNQDKNFKKIDAEVDKLLEGLSKYTTELDVTNQLTNKYVRTLSQANPIIKKQFDEFNNIALGISKGSTAFQKQVNLSSELLGIMEKTNGSATELSFLLQKDEVAMKELTNFSKEFSTQIKNGTTAIERMTLLDEELLSLTRGMLGYEKQLNTIIDKNTKAYEKRARASEKANISSKNPYQRNTLDKLSGIPRRTASMFVTMAGFNEMMNVYELSKEYSQAVEQIDYFSKRLEMSQTQFVGYQKELQNLQSQFQKVDMYSVGASAEESALKYKLPINALGELTKAYAVTSSAFVKEGRTQEDAILAVNDAMDGQFRRMYELDGNFKDHLKEAGWSGDLKDKASMLNAFNKVLNDMGFEQTAKDITNFNDAVTVAEIKISQDLGGAFHKIEPLLTNIGKLFIGVIEGLEGFSNWLDSTFGSKSSDFVLNFIVSLGIELGILWGAFKGYKWIKNTYQELKTFAQTVNTTIDSVKKGIPKLSEWWSKLRGKDSTTGGTGGDLTTTRGKIKKQNDELKKTTKEMDTVGKTAQTSGTTVKKSQTRFTNAKNNIKTASVYIFGSLLIILGALALIMGGIALIGAEYQAFKPQIDSGKQALEQLAPIIISILVPVSVFAMVMQYYGKTINPATIKNSVMGIALGLGLVAEAIFMLTPSLLAIGLLGYVNTWLGDNVDQGIQAISKLGQVLQALASPVGLLLIGATILGAVLVNSGLSLVAIESIAVGMAVISAGILSLALPLLGVAGLGWINQTFGNYIDQGILAIQKVGIVLKQLYSPVGLLIVGATVLGAVLLSTGGIGLAVLFASLVTGMATISAGILSLALPLLGIAGLGYLNDKFGGGINSGIEAITKVGIAIRRIAQTIKPLISAIQTIVDALSGWGIIQGALTGLSLGAKLGEIITVVTEIMSFATKLGTVSGDGGGANTTAVASISRGISKLTNTIQRFVTSINGKATQLRSAGVRLGRALPTGFSQGATGFSAKVNQIIQGAVIVALASNGMWSIGGRTMGISLVNGFKSTSNKLRTTVNTEIDYAIQQANSRKQDMYNTGADLGRSFSDGFSSTKGLDQHSPGLVARTTAQEIVYALQSIDKGVTKMYSAGANLGSSLSNGYNSNFKTDMSSVKSVSGSGSSNGLGLSIVTSSSDTGTTNNNTKNNSTILNISFDGATFIGESDLKETMKKIAQEVFIDYNTPSKHTGY